MGQQRDDEGTTTDEMLAGALDEASEVAHAVDALGGDGNGRSPLTEVSAALVTGDDRTTWRVRAARIVEVLDAPYEAEVVVVTDDVVSASTLLGAPARLTLRRIGQASRDVTGVVRRVDDLGVADGKHQLRVEVAPRLWLLSLRRDCRIFQDRTARQIVDEVLDAAGLYAGSDARSWERVRASLAVREYCVQYQETDLNFVSRLLQEEGVAFYVSGDGDGAERVVFFDVLAGATEAADGDGRSAYAVRGDEMRTARDESIRRLDWSDRAHSRSVVLRDYNFTTPSATEAMTTTSAESRAEGSGVYQYPGRFTLVDAHHDATSNHEHTYPQHDGSARAAVRLGELQRDAHTGHGEGNVMSFAAGRRFSAMGHGRHDLDGRALVLTRVEHSFRAREATRGEHDGADHTAREGYHNRFECVPADGVYRPRREARQAAIWGTQTATVMGPDDPADPAQREEIHCDVHGRIKVKFHWDRAANVPATQRSCWIRVAQVWAGAPWGFMFVPRRGTEVVVSFLEGNPDRPLVVGSVYNGENRPRYDLPEERTKSWIRTQSTPGGDPSRYNELRFEDRAGHEEVGLHAQRDLVETVRHDHKTSVHANQTNTVQRNQREHVGGDQTLSVSGNRTKTVDHDENNTVHGDRWSTVGRYDSLQVQGSQSVVVSHVAQMQVDEGYSVHANQRVRVDATDLADDLGQVILVPDHVTIQQGASTTVRLDANKISLRQGTARITVEDGKIELDTGHGAMLRLEGDHVALCSRGGATQLTLTEKAHLHAQGAVDVRRTGGASLVLHRDAELKGDTVKLNP